MACIVTGFPSSIAALQFEWAWQNPHITHHIPPSSRISHATQKKRSGHPKRPRHSIQSLLSNLHILLSVPSFSRWPLEVRFFSPDVHKAWIKSSKGAIEPLRNSLPNITNFPSAEQIVTDSKGGETTSGHHGIEALKVAYEDMKPHLEKGKKLFNPDMKEACEICNQDLQHNSGLHTLCPNTDCGTITHMTCLSRYFLQGEKNKQLDELLVPIKGVCPSCKMEVRWNDLVKELSLRVRGQQVVEKLLKPKRVKRAAKGAAASQAIVESDDDWEKEEEEEDYINMGEFEPQNLEEEENEFKNYFDSDDSDTMSVASIASTKPQMRSGPVTQSRLITVIEDSDIDEDEELNG
ncbi:hypothetical protein OCU04_001260 [Sclerotinia nivalis]|uniref:Structure-specific endonuclease subunit SLX1 C-terminal domain-containing protein n=1 Tax=Sclerotinia nivalis TaxID=352851 RepID=A0A9X0AXS3_9HELO|nr:hypothetical protein OCU04_001260 [Sclerotinia nivalis]